MRYPRGIKRFLLPSIVLHLFIISLAIFLFKASHNEQKLTTYEIALVKLQSKSKSKIDNKVKHLDENEIKEVDTSQATKKVTLSKSKKIIKRKEEKSTIVFEDSPGHSTTKENSAVSSDIQSNPASGVVSSAGTDAQQAYPDYSLNPKPVYPLMARRRGYEGTVLIRVKVLKNGKVGELDIQRSSQYEILDKTALNTVSDWTFVPAKRNGISVTSWVTVPIKFELKGS